jgi:hypothetical protein
MFENRPESKAHPWYSPLHADEHGGSPQDMWQRRSTHAGEHVPAAAEGAEQKGHGLVPAPAEAAQVMSHYGDDAEAAEGHTPPEPTAAPPEEEAPAGHDTKAEHGEAHEAHEAHEAGQGGAVHKQQDPVEAAGAQQAQREAAGDSLATSAAGPSSEAEPEPAHGLAAHENQADHDEHEGNDEHEGSDEHASAGEHGEGHDHDAHQAEHPGESAHAAPRRAALRSTAAAPAPAPSTAAPTPAAPSPAPSGSRSRSRTFAEVDRYNPTLASNPFTDKKKQLQRPGIRVKGRDKFKVKGGAQPRYLITDGNHVKVADRVTNKNSKGKPNDIAINIAHTRKLELEPGKPPVECVLVFVRGRGAAWMPMDGLVTGTDKSTLRKKVNEKASKHQPRRVPKNTKFTRYTFRASVPPSGIDDDYIQPNRTNGADMVEHYLKREVDTGLGKKRSYYNVSLNLPQKKVPPTAVDTAEPGAPFFAFDGKQFERSVSVFGEKKKKAKSQFAWVFGYLGKRDADGNWVPDEARRGWVPKRCLRMGE